MSIFALENLIDQSDCQKLKIERSKMYRSLFGATSIAGLFNTYCLIYRQEQHSIDRTMTESFQGGCGQPNSI
jgi:hypothetical protein